jgi:ABC-type transporter Mla subunit MlaD
VEIKITKKHIIGVSIVICLCIACFCAGRYIRIGRITGTSQQLIDGIVLSRDTTDTILNKLNIAANEFNSSAEYNRAVIEGFERLQRTNEIGQLCINKIERTIEDSQEFAKMLNESYSQFSDRSEYAFDVAIRKSEEYERVIESLQQFTGNFIEDNKKPE